MTLSIRWKVILGTLLAVASGFFVAWLLAIHSLERQAVAQLKETLEVRTQLVTSALRPLFDSEGHLLSLSGLRSVIRELGTHADARITLVSTDGTVIADSAVSDAELPAVENHRSRPEIQQALATARGTDIRISHTTGKRTMYLAVPVHGGSQPSSPVILRLGHPMTKLDEDIDELERSLLLAMGIAFAVAVALSLGLAHTITKPVTEIAAAARRLASGDLQVRARTTSRDEVGLLADTLNHMTDRLRLQIEELSEDRAQLLAMLTSMVEGVVVLDYRGRVLQVNPALERMFDVRGAAARGRDCQAVFGQPQLTTLVSTILASRTAQEGEITLPQSGRCLHVEASIAGGERENEACAVLVFHDITDLRRLEKIRKDFVANVSHELRTPLTSIKGYVEALLDGAKDDPATSQQFLDIILKQTDRLNLILEDLLQLSKIESGQVVLKHESLYLPSVVDRTLSMIKPLADKKGHQVILHIAPDLPLVAGDEERLGQVLTNLLDNAVKYTPEGGKITVAAHLVPEDLSSGSAPRMVEISVTDTGIGIPEEDRPRVFERFYRVDKARSRELGGTGLGLAIVKHLVEGHGGQVWVEGNLPTGSRFVVRLPVRQETVTPAA